MATIPFADVIDRKLMPVDAQNVVTRVRLVVAGDLAGKTPETLQVVRLWDTREESNTESYAPEPITYVYTAPEHALYGAERSFALPSGVNPFLLPTDLLIPEPTVDPTWVNPGVPSAVRDGDPFTYAETTGSGIARIQYPSVPGVSWVGWRLVYEYAATPPLVGPRISVFYGRSWPDGPGGPGSRARHLVWESGELPETPPEQEAGMDLYAVVPPDVRFNQVNNVDVFSGPLESRITLRAWGEQDIRVYAFYPLGLNEVLLESIARAQVRLPGLVPSRVTVRGYVPPDRTHTITGWPGGDYTGRVAQHQYELGATVIDLEQAGSPVGLPAEAMEAARERQTAVDNDILTANYNLKMGSRR